MVSNKTWSLTTVAVLGVLTFGPCSAEECVPLDVSSPTYQVETGTTPFDAAVLAAEYAEGKDADEAAKIAAEISLQIGASEEDMALIIAKIAQTLNTSTAQTNALASSVAKLTCANDGLLRGYVGQTLIAIRKGGKEPGTFDDDLQPVTSDNPNITGPGRPISPN